MLIALLLEEMVTALGFEVVGPAMRLDAALSMARSESFDCAILDVNLASEKSFPVAEVLRQRGLPFIFATGYGSQGLDEAYRDIRTLQKPFQAEELGKAIRQAIGAG